uniref:PduL/EutD family phosphate acyltransferase n=1 Tax=Thiohalocapsa sp. TaxID=2497641 RepID=UPI0025F0B468
MIATTQSLDRQQVEQLVRQVLRSQWGAIGQTFRPTSHNGGPNPLVVNVSARHIHVTQEHLEVLFGTGSQLTKLKDLYQDGEFASEQVVNIIGPRNRLVPVARILAPTPTNTQAELSSPAAVFHDVSVPTRVTRDD